MDRNIRKVTRTRKGQKRINYRSDQEVGDDDDDDDPIEIEGLGDIHDIEEPLKEPEVLRTLYYDYGMSKPEIADELDVSKTAVSMQMGKFEIGL